jgi:hypothetical protein
MIVYISVFSESFVAWDKGAAEKWAILGNQG